MFHWCLGVLSLLLTFAVVPNIRGGQVGRHGDPRVPGLGGCAGVHRGLALGGVDSQQIVAENTRRYKCYLLLVVRMMRAGGQ